MKNLSLSSLGGICFIIGGVLAFIPFLFQILASGPPEEGVHIFSYFAKNTVAGGDSSLLYVVFSGIGLSLVAYSTFVLNSIMQKRSPHPIMGLGSFLFIIAQIGLIVAWSIDLAIVFGAETANVGNLFMMEMGMFFTWGPVGFIGGALFSLALAERGFINPLFLRGAALLYAITALVFVYTLLTIEYFSASTIMMLFTAISISQIVSIVWQILVGRKMMSHVSH